MVYGMCLCEFGGVSKIDLNFELKCRISARDYLFLFHGLLLDGLSRFVGVRRLDWGLSFLGVCRLLLGEGEGGDLLRDLKWQMAK